MSIDHGSSAKCRRSRKAPTDLNIWFMRNKQRPYGLSRNHVLSHRSPHYGTESHLCGWTSSPCTDLFLFYFIFQLFSTKVFNR